MLFSQYPTISQNYLILCFVVCLGTLQWSAARNRRLGLSLLGRWGLGKSGSIVGIFLITAGFGWFFTVTPGLFDTGLAGGELATLFGVGGLSALLVTRLLGSFWQKFD
jgi:hypothetical protein